MVEVVKRFCDANGCFKRMEEDYFMKYATWTFAWTNDILQHSSLPVKQCLNFDIVWDL